MVDTLTAPPRFSSAWNEEVRCAGGSKAGSSRRTTIWARDGAAGSPFRGARFWWFAEFDRLARFVDGDCAVAGLEADFGPAGSAVFSFEVRVAGFYRSFLQSVRGKF
jgi:hypothetical protein